MTLILYVSNFSVLRTLGSHPKVLHTKGWNLYIRRIQYVFFFVAIFFKIQPNSANVCFFLSFLHLFRSKNTTDNSTEIYVIDGKYGCYILHAENPICLHSICPLTITFKCYFIIVLFKCREYVFKCIFVQAPEVVMSLHRIFSICLAKKLIDNQRRP